jgi:hypothetical protein
MNVARFALAPVGETMFPPRAPFLKYDRENLPVPPVSTPPPPFIGQRAAQ